MCGSGLQSFVNLGKLWWWHLDENYTNEKVTLLNAVINTLHQQNDNETQSTSEFPSYFFFPVVEYSLDSFLDAMHMEINILKVLNKL